jgi:hypothetical protein
VKISKLTNGLLVSLLLTASVAGADSKYPATDFQPKVVYQDSDYKHSGSASSSKATSGAKVSVADPDYPAANFKPEVLFKDDSYKHSKGNEGKTITTEFVKQAIVEKTEAIEESTSSDDSSLSLVLGLGILAVAGFVFYQKNNSKKTGTKNAGKTVRRKKASASTSSSVSSVSENSGASGVSKYLESKVEAKPSRVEQYLEEKNTSTSSVSKYVAKKKISARVASVTGVEKYLKDKG